MKTDIQIAQEAQMMPIREVTAGFGITEDDMELYGKYKAELSNLMKSQYSIFHANPCVIRIIHAVMLACQSCHTAN